MTSTQIEGRWFRALALLMALAAGGSTLSCAGEADDGEPSDGALLVVLHPHDGPTVTYGGGLYLQLLDVQAPEGAAVDLTASVEPSMSASIEPSSLVGGGVAELLMRPTQDRAEQTATFEVRAVSGARHASASGTFDIITWEDDGPEYADSLLAIFPRARAEPQHRVARELELTARPRRDPPQLSQRGLGAARGVAQYHSPA
jgi:hypothetical protein